MKRMMSVPETDQKLLAALTSEHGAVEDMTELKSAVLYFLSTGHKARVDRRTGKVSITLPKAK